MTTGQSAQVNATGLVVAKAPIAGHVKTRLGATIGADEAAQIAAACLLDTLATMEATFAQVHLCLEGDLTQAASAEKLVEVVAGWSVSAQRGAGLDERLVHAHHDAAHFGLPVVQVGMDTPHMTAHDLRGAALPLLEAAKSSADAVLGLADDGGWWVLGVREPAMALPLLGVPMSSPDTGSATLGALEAAGLRVGLAARMADIDNEAELDAVATTVARQASSRPGEERIDGASMDAPELLAAWRLLPGRGAR